MQKLTIEEVLSEESKYSAVIAVAKLARKIGQEASLNGDILTEKPVSTAIEYLKEHKYLITESQDFQERV